MVEGGINPEVEETVCGVVAKQCLQSFPLPMPLERDGNPDVRYGRHHLPLPKSGRTPRSVIFFGKTLVEGLGLNGLRCFLMG